ncbi:unnamed protein product [Allacma fusca]|uniref:Major facilitator superfamily (MFS) profile domain-containing protein n=1 Tax=Allacma fusca TaxID=39272 RepID=A0A8J2LGB6_9HEXA|nr:unnamed protein product [Allacma fusca]
MLGMSVWNVACGRLLQGIGSGAGTALLAEFGRVTTSKERTTFLSIFNATFQIGMIFGPVIQIVVSYLNFEIFGITLNALNGPGLVWTILWSLLMLKALFFFSNLTKDFNEPRNSQSDISLKPMMAKFGGRNEQESSGSGDQKSSTRDDIFPNNSKQERDFPSKSHSTLLLMVFVAFFCQGALETMVTVVTEEYFGFGVRENALVFEFMALEALLVFFGVAFLGKFVRETILQITGWLNLVLALVVLIHLMSKIEHENKIHMVSFLTGLFISVLGIQILSAASIILSSKVISVDTHGPGKGTRHIMCFLGLILGPNWAGATIQMPILLLGFLLAITLFTGVRVHSLYIHYKLKLQ